MKYLCREIQYHPFAHKQLKCILYGRALCIHHLAVDTQAVDQRELCSSVDWPTDKPTAVSRAAWLQKVAPGEKDLEGCILVPGLPAFPPSPLTTLLFSVSFLPATSEQISTAMPCRSCFQDLVIATRAAINMGVPVLL